MQRRLISLLQRTGIEGHKVFQRLANKTQVRFPGKDDTEVIRNRLTHSYEVATSAEMMVASLAEKHQLTFDDIDYEGSVAPCSLMHDVGLPPFGHDGQRLLHQVFSGMGVEEGFCDNNNNLTVIEKNHIMVSDHTLASLIKYPDKLYPYQQAKYTPILARAIEQDTAHFSALGIAMTDRKRTIACDIMDEADRNTYICSDLSDYLCLGNELQIKALKQLADEHNLAYRFGELSTLFAIAASRDKSTIKAYFNTLKNRLNQNLIFNGKGLAVQDSDLNAYREFLWDVEYRYYIVPNRREPQHHQNMSMFSAYIDRVVKEGYAPSRTYRILIEQAKTEVEKLRLQRDMIAESTDWFVTKVQLSAQAANTAPHQPLHDFASLHGERVKDALAQYYREEFDPDTVG